MRLKIIPLIRYKLKNWLFVVVIRKVIGGLALSTLSARISPLKSTRINFLPQLKSTQELHKSNSAHIQLPKSNSHHQNKLPDYPQDQGLPAAPASDKGAG